MTAAELWRRGQHGWPASYPVAQFPNAPLLVWMAARGAEALVDGSAEDTLQVVGSVALAVWAVLELGWGTNAFRRVLGAVALGSIGVGLLGVAE